MGPSKMKKYKAKANAAVATRASEDDRHEATNLTNLGWVNRGLGSSKYASGDDSEDELDWPRNDPSTVSVDDEFRPYAYGAISTYYLDMDLFGFWEVM
jgi:hypothetical protein